MAYAKIEDLIIAFGADSVEMRLGLDENGTLITLEAERALSSASHEIDSYLASRYTLPLKDIPDLLVQMASDIAWYRLGTEQGKGLSEEKRKRYDDAIKLLCRIADGKASLPILATDEDGDGDIDAIDGPNASFIEGPARQFTRDKLKDL